jgi:hypothetical protein
VALRDRVTLALPVGLPERPPEGVAVPERHSEGEPDALGLAESEGEPEGEEDSQPEGVAVTLLVPDALAVFEPLPVAVDVPVSFAVFEALRDCVMVAEPEVVTVELRDCVCVADEEAVAVAEADERLLLVGDEEPVPVAVPEASAVGDPASEKEPELEAVLDAEPDEVAVAHTTPPS